VGGLPSQVWKMQQVCFDSGLVSVRWCLFHSLLDSWRVGGRMIEGLGGGWEGWIGDLSDAVGMCS
jgi:hypothetical protein